MGLSGPENGETVLLLHGGVENSRSLLETIVPALSERYCVVAFDRRGRWGTGDTAEAFHYDAMADDRSGSSVLRDTPRPPSTTDRREPGHYRRQYRRVLDVTGNSVG
jgi:pimeloyl-ACP methyl ester carboxylesterase